MTLNSKAQIALEQFNKLMQMPNEMVVAIQQRMKETQEGIEKPVFEKVMNTLEKRDYDKNEFLNITFDISSKMVEELPLIVTREGVAATCLRLYIDMRNIERTILVKGNVVEVK